MIVKMGNNNWIEDVVDVAIAVEVALYCYHVQCTVIGNCSHTITEPPLYGIVGQMFLGVYMQCLCASTSANAHQLRAAGIDSRRTNIGSCSILSDSSHHAKRCLRSWLLRKKTFDDPPGLQPE